MTIKMDQKAINSLVSATTGFSTTAAITLHQIHVSVTVIKEQYVYLEQGATKIKLLNLDIIDNTWKTAIKQAEELSKDWAKKVSAITDSKERETIDVALTILESSISDTQQAQTALDKRLVNDLKVYKGFSTLRREDILYLNGFLSIIYIIFLFFFGTSHSSVSDFIRALFTDPDHYVTLATSFAYFTTFLMFKIRPLSHIWYTFFRVILTLLAVVALFLFPIWLGLDEPLILLMPYKEDLDYESVTFIQMVLNLRWLYAISSLVTIASPLLIRVESLRMETFLSIPYTELIDALQSQKNVRFKRLSCLIKQMRLEMSTKQ